MKKWLLIILISAAAATLAAAFFFRVEIKEKFEEWTAQDLPPAQTADELAGAPSAEDATWPASLPPSINLDIPFVSQAPFANWDQPYQDACEEASIIMAYRFIKNLPLNPAIMDNEIKRMVEWEVERFGYYIDTTVEETATILREYLRLESTPV